MNNKTTKVFISCPMLGRSEGEIIDEMNYAKINIEKQIDDPEYLDSRITELPPRTKSEALWYMGKGLQLMADADVVYFCNGWQHARGCLLEHQAALAYGKRIMIEG